MAFSSIGGILSTAYGALSAHQTALQVSAHNISNVNTEGYSRQRAELSTGYPLLTPEGALGTGVRLTDVSRARDALLDTAVRRERSQAAEYRLRHDMLSRVEGLFSEPSESGLAATMDAFWRSWADLANEPTSSTAREVVQDRGQQLASHLNHLVSGLADVEDGARDQLEGAVTDLNQLARDLADVNRQLQISESGGHTAPDLRDRRDLLIDQMAEIAPVQVVARDNGGVGVTVSGLTLVDGAEAYELEVEYDNSRSNPWAVKRVGGTSATTGGRGALGAALDTLNEEIPTVRERLDTLASAIVDSVNRWHRLGTNSRGDTGVDFFAGDSAATIRLADAVKNDTQAIVAGPADETTGSYQAGANDIALKLAGLQYEHQLALGKTLAEPVQVAGKDSAASAWFSSSTTPLYELMEWTDPPQGDGTVTIGGTDYLVDFSQSLEEIRDTINATGGAVSAQLETNADGTLHRLVLVPSGPSLSAADVQDDPLAESLGLIQGTRSLGDYYNETVTGVGLAVSSAEDRARVHETLAAQAETRRSSVSGVSTDEELIKITQHQQAYAAAARVVSAADEMLQTLLNMV